MTGMIELGPGEKYPSKEDLEAYTSLGKILDELPRNKDGKPLKRWKKDRAYEIKTFGPDVIYSLLPENLSCQTLRINKSLYSLRREHKIYSIQELASYTPKREKGIGEKSLEFIEVLHEVALAELRRRKSS